MVDEVAATCCECLLGALRGRSEVWGVAGVWGVGMLDLDLFANEKIDLGGTHNLKT